MKTLYNKTIEGKQYFIELTDKNRLEYNFENVNPLVGGGATFEITTHMKENKWIWNEIKNIFGDKIAREIYATAMTLEKFNYQIKQEQLFNEEYEKNLQSVIKRKDLPI